MCCPFVTNECTCLIYAAAALFERTGGRVPTKETKTYLGAGLAVLAVNLVSCAFDQPT